MLDSLHCFSPRRYLTQRRDAMTGPMKGGEAPLLSPIANEFLQVISCKMSMGFTQILFVVSKNTLEMDLVEENYQTSWWKHTLLVDVYVYTYMHIYIYLYIYIYNQDISPPKKNILKSIHPTKMVESNNETTSSSSALRVGQCDSRLERNPTRSYQLQAGSRVQVGWRRRVLPMFGTRWDMKSFFYLFFLQVSTWISKITIFLNKNMPWFTRSFEPTRSHCD